MLETITKYFRSFRKEHLGKLSFDLHPLPADIPEYEKLVYDPSSDILEIIFKCENSRKEVKLDDIVSLYIDVKNNHLAGLRIVGTNKNKIGAIDLTIRKKFEDIVNQWENEIKEEKSWDKQLNLLGQLSLEKRKIDYFQHLVSALPSRQS